MSSCFEDSPDDRPRHAGELAEKLTSLLRDGKNAPAEPTTVVSKPARSYNGAWPTAWR